MRATSLSPLLLVCCTAGALAVLAGPAFARPAAASAAASSTKVAVPAKLVDINSATLAQLQALPGIDQAQAERIVSGRPYLSKGDLVAGKVLPAGVYLAIKGRIMAKQDLKRPPTGSSRK
mgnify:CR=1 FL=1